MPLIITPGQLAIRGELYHQLGIMLSAGLGLPQALDQATRKGPRSFREPLEALIRHLNDGLTFGESLDQLGTWAPSFDRALLEAGEKSGRLDVCFKLLGEYYRERSEMAKQVISDMLYPLFIFHFAAVIFPFVSAVSSHNWGLFFTESLLIIGPFWAAVFFLLYACQGKRGEYWRSMIEKTLRPVPLVGAGRRHLALARLSAALEALLNAGVSVIGAWELAATASGSPALRREVLGWKPHLESGATPAELVSRSPEFPEVFTSLYHTGEISGQLDQTLARLHTLHQSEGSRKLRAVAQWAPKIVYLGILLVVAYKIINFYVGYFNQISDAMKPLN